MTWSDWMPKRCQTRDTTVGVPRKIIFQDLNCKTTKCTNTHQILIFNPCWIAVLRSNCCQSSKDNWNASKIERETVSTEEEKRQIKKCSYLFETTDDFVISSLFRAILNVSWANTAQENIASSDTNVLTTVNGSQFIVQTIGRIREIVKFTILSPRSSNAHSLQLTFVTRSPFSSKFWAPYSFSHDN